MGGGLMCLFVNHSPPGRYGTCDNIGIYPGQPDFEVPRRRAILRLLNDSTLLGKQTNENTPQ